MFVLTGGGGLTLSGTETLLFLSQLSLTHFYYANEAIKHRKGLMGIRGNQTGRVSANLTA